MWDGQSIEINDRRAYPLKWRQRLGKRNKLKVAWTILDPITREPIHSTSARTAVYLSGPKNIAPKRDEGKYDYEQKKSKGEGPQLKTITLEPTRSTPAWCRANSIMASRPKPVLAPPQVGRDPYQKNPKKGDMNKKTKNIPPKKRRHLTGHFLAIYLKIEGAPPGPPTGAFWPNWSTHQSWRD